MKSEHILMIAAAAMVAGLIYGYISKTSIGTTLGATTV